MAKSLERALKKTDPQAASAREDDATQVAAVLLRHWGDDAPLILAKALELARTEVARWRFAPLELTPLEEYIQRSLIPDEPGPGHLP